MENFEEYEQTTKAKVEDSLNQILPFTFFTDIREIKEKIAATEFKSLEEYTGKSTEELDKFKPSFSRTYNNIITELKKPDLTIEKLNKLKEEMFMLIKS